MAIDKSEKSLPELFSDLVRETGDLVRQEIALARAELSQKMATVQPALMSVAVGAVIALAGVFIILQAIVNAIAMLLPPGLAPWLAPLIVGGAVAAIGYMMLKGGAAKLQPDNLVPRRTINSLRRDKVMAEEKVR